MTEPITDDFIAKWKKVTAAAIEHGKLRMVVYATDFDRMLDEIMEQKKRIGDLEGL